MSFGQTSKMNRQAALSISTSRAACAGGLARRIARAARLLVMASTFAAPAACNANLADSGPELLGTDTAALASSTTLKNASHNSCLQHTSAGLRVARCSSTSNAQRWELTQKCAVVTLDPYVVQCFAVALKNRSTGKCLDGGSPSLVGDCSAGDEEQWWHVSSAPGNTYVLTNYSTGKELRGLSTGLVQYSNYDSGASSATSYRWFGALSGY